MKEEQKTKIKETVGNVADELSDKALAAAKEQTNKFWKLMLYIVGIMLAGIAALAGFTGCENITPEQVQAAHALYHAASGEPCVFVVESAKK
jgi:hypothetical protein